MATTSGDLKTKFTDDLGEPLVGGKVYTYHAGTSTPKDSYKDKEFTIVNTNPIILDDAGSCDLYLNGLYRLRVLDKDGVFVEERDYMTQGDSTGSSITDNANNITVLQSEVQAINERSVLKLDENNFVIGHGSANSATVHDPAFRLDKLKVAKSGDAESAKLLFNTYGEDTEVEGETVEEGSYIDPDLITQPLVKNWRDVERAAFKGTKKDNNTNLLLKVGDSVPENSAASRLVGVGNDQIPLSEDIAGASKKIYRSININPRLNLDTLENIQLGVNTSFYFHSSYHTGISNIPKRPANGSIGVILVYEMPTNNYVQELSFNGIDHQGYWRKGRKTSTGYEWNSWHYSYGTNNTKLDTNGAISPSSPTIDLYSDRIETNADGSRMNPEFVRNGVGDYTIKNTTGLRDDGWYIKIPNDMNGNPKVAVAVDTDKDGNLSIKTYKRTFSLETFTFGPDLNEPLDIPEGRWIDLRFNDIPQEQLDEPIE